MAGHRCVKAREQRYTDTGMARGGSSRKLPEERSVLRRLALALCYLTDRTRNPQRLAELLDVLSDEEILPDASTAELELVAKEVECIAAGDNVPTVARADE